jgi:hypothetical protein
MVDNMHRIDDLFIKTYANVNFASTYRSSSTLKALTTTHKSGANHPFELRIQSAV